MQEESPFLTDKVDLREHVTYYHYKSLHNMILQYLMDNKGEWFSAFDISKHVGAKNALAVGVRIRQLVDEFNIECEKKNRIMRYRFNSKFPVDKKYFRILEIIEDRRGRWVSSRQIAKMMNIPSREVGIMLHYFTKWFGIERNIKKNVSYYRYKIK